MFPRSMVEFFAAFTFADISMAKANSFLGLVTNKLFRGSDIPYRSLQTIEDKIKKACFPEGCKVMDITRKKDGNQKVCSPALYYACTLLVFLLVLGKKKLKLFIMMLFGEQEENKQEHAVHAHPRGVHCTPRG